MTETEMTDLERQALAAALADFDREAEIVLARFRALIAETQPELAEPNA